MIKLKIQRTGNTIQVRLQRPFLQIIDRFIEQVGTYFLLLLHYTINLIIIIFFSVNWRHALESGVSHGLKMKNCHRIRLGQNPIIFTGVETSVLKIESHFKQGIYLNLVQLQPFSFIQDSTNENLYGKFSIGVELSDLRGPISCKKLIDTFVSVFTMRRAFSRLLKTNYYFYILI